MKLTGDQRRALLDIVIRLEDGGTPPPRIAGDVGQFLADIAALRADAEGLLPHDGAFVRGSAVGPIRLLPLAPLAEQIRPDPMGEVASTVAVSDELGVVVNVTLWAAARPANRLRNLWLRGPQTVRLSGQYRWFVPRRITPGSAAVSVCQEQLDIWQFRCLRFVAEDFASRPTALSYCWDSTFGPPDFRVFRVVALQKTDLGWRLVAAQRVQQPELELDWDQDAVPGADVPLALALLARDPWSQTWSAVAHRRVGPAGVLGHLISWADHRRELLCEPSPPAGEVAALQANLRRQGISSSVEDGLREANLVRSVAQPALPLAAAARGLA